MVEQNPKILMKQEGTKEWVRLLPCGVLTMNSQESSSTGYTPEELFDGRLLRRLSKRPSLRTTRAPLGIG